MTGTDRLVLEIVRTLESHGLPRDAYQLGKEFDPEALARLVESGGDAVEVRLEIHGIPLVVTESAVRIREEESSSPPTCPHCRAPITAIVQLVPTHHNAYPCGCRLARDTLE
ncbi:hypothetical protein [Halostagnicola sp. A56]|uniref:hypothetical protein n=1 Tax=Halostagnicola sp. A56 TaxID=1495067 RepID=UPI00049F0D8E|nr:hypothetical protein [Halostagnicola sp. A56]